MSSKSLKKNLVYYFILSASQVVLPIVSIPYISRTLDPAGVGRVSFIDSYTYYFIAIAELGITVYGSRAVARLRDDEKELRKLVAELLTLHVISSLITLALYTCITFFVYHHIGDLRLIGFSVGLLVFNSLACEWYFLGMEQFKYISIRSLSIRLTALICIFLLVKEPGDYYLYYGVMASATVLVGVCNIYFLWKRQPISFKGINWKKHVRYTWVTYLISLIYSINLFLDSVLLGLLSTAYVVGIYAFAIKIARTTGTLLIDSSRVFFPGIVRHIQDQNRPELQRSLLRSVQMIIVFSIPMLAGTILLSKELVLGILGKGFEASADALRILAFFPALRAYNVFLNNQILIPYNREKKVLISLAAGSVVFLALSFLLSGIYMEKGICIAIISAELVGLAFNYYYVKKTDRLLVIFDRTSFFQSLVASMTFFPLIYAIRLLSAQYWTTLLLSIGFCFLAYAVIQAFVFRNVFIVAIKKTFLQYISRQATSF